MADLIYDLPFASYQSIDALNASTAVHGLDSMLHLEAAIEGKLDPNESKEINIGKIVHALVEGQRLDIVKIPDFHLKENGNVTDGKREIKTRPAKCFLKDGLTPSAHGKAWFELCDKHGKPHDFDGEIFTGKITGQRETDSKNTNHYKSRVAEFRKQNAGCLCVGGDEYDRIFGIYDRLKSDPKVLKAMENSRHEVTVVGEILGVKCKIRLDGLKRHDDPLRPYSFWDLKTTQSADTKLFCKHCFSLHIPFRMTFYHLVLKSIGIEADAALIAVENNGAHDTNVVPLYIRHFEEWQDEVLRVVQQFKDSAELGEWPGRYDSPQEFFIPPWEMKSPPHDTGDDYADEDELAEAWRESSEVADVEF